MRYLVVVEEGATSFGAYVPDLPGCVATAWSFVAALAPQGSWKLLGVVAAAAAFAFICGPAFLPLEKRRALEVADEILQAT